MTLPYFTWADAKVSKISEIKGDEAAKILSGSADLWESHVGVVPARQRGILWQCRHQW